MKKNCPVHKDINIELKHQNRKDNLAPEDIQYKC